MIQPEPPLPSSLHIDSPASFLAALKWATQVALAQRSRTMVWADPSFDHWPLDDEALLASLAAWLRQPLRQLTLLRSGGAAMSQRHPRFARWGATWSHAVQWRLAPADALALPSAAWVQGAAIVVLDDPSLWLGQARTQRAAVQQWGEQIDVVLQRSQPGPGFTTLGL